MDLPYPEAAALAGRCACRPQVRPNSSGVTPGMIGDHMG